MRAIPHDDPNIRFSSVKPDGSRALCAPRPPQCSGQWWTEPNDSGFRSVIERQMATHGPLTYMWTTFSASEQLIVLGHVNGSMDDVTLYFSDIGGGEEIGPLVAHKPPGNNYMIFNKTGFDPTLQYSMALVYAGTGTLRILGLLAADTVKLLSPSVPKNAPVVAVATPETSSRTTVTEPVITVTATVSSFPPQYRGIDGARLCGAFFGASALGAVIAFSAWYLMRRLRARHASRQTSEVVPSSGRGGSTQPYALFPGDGGKLTTLDAKLSTKGVASEESNTDTTKSSARSHTSTVSGDEISRALDRAGLSRRALLKSLRRLYSRPSEITFTTAGSTACPPRYAE